MALEYQDGILSMEPGIYDVHGHGRAFDPLPLGKAGLMPYTETALASGITMINFMPNEAFRVPTEDGGSELMQAPVSNAERVAWMETMIRNQSYIRAGYNVGIDRSEIIDEDGRLMSTVAWQIMSDAAWRAVGFKKWVDESTGGQNLTIPQAAQLIDQDRIAYPGKVETIHAEDGNVADVLEAALDVQNLTSNPRRKVKIHVAHVSSQQELEAVIAAREHGLDVTCEVTPHHLFATAGEGSQIGGYGCMKPSLKSPDDVKFLWDHMDQIDIIASDCAPHRREEKEADKPAWGVTNHTVMMPLLLGAMEEGRISPEELYKKLVVNPRLRFGQPMHDGTKTVFDLSQSFASVSEVESEIDPKYGHNIFEHLEKLGKRYHLAGKVVYAASGESWVRRDERGVLHGNFRVSLNHLVTA